MKPTQICRAAFCAASLVAFTSCANRPNHGQQNNLSVTGNGNMVSQTTNYIAAPTMGQMAQRGAPRRGYAPSHQCTPETPCGPQRQPSHRPPSYQNGNCVVTPGFITRVDNATGQVIAIIPDAPSGGGYPPPQYRPQPNYGQTNYRPQSNYGPPPQYRRPQQRPQYN